MINSSLPPRAFPFFFESRKCSNCLFLRNSGRKTGCPLFLELLLISEAEPDSYRNGTRGVSEPSRLQGPLVAKDLAVRVGSFDMDIAGAMCGEIEAEVGILGNRYPTLHRQDKPVVL